MHFKSVKHSQCPEISSAIRAETLISGYVIEENGMDKEGKLSTKLTIVS
jgi:hypothetical protein